MPVVHTPGSIMGKHEHDPVTLSKIISAKNRIQNFIHRTPVMTCAYLDRLAGKNLFFKCENFQKTGSFKIRGATNSILRIKEEKGLNFTPITHSSGNHGQALALSSSHQSVKGVVVVPDIAPKSKKNAIEEYGAQVVECESTAEGRVAKCQDELNKLGENGEFVPAGNHPFIMEGQGTIAVEMLEDNPELDAVMIACSCGGLLAGNSVACKAIKPDIKVFGCEPSKADDLAQSFAAGERVMLNCYPDTIADGLRMSVCDKTWPIIKENVECSILVSEEEIIDAMYMMWQRMKIIVEPSAAVPLAAVLTQEFKALSKGLNNIGILVCGGNADLNKIPWMNK